MAQTATHTRSNGRAAALARRRAMSSGGKEAIALSPDAGNADPQQSAKSGEARSRTRLQVQKSAQSTARSASMARHQAMASKGMSGASGKDWTRSMQTSVERAIEIANAAAAARAMSASGNDCGCGCKQQTADDKAAKSDQIEFSGSASERIGSTARLRATARQTAALSAGRAASRARRNQMAARGKAGLISQGLVPEQAMRAANPQMNSRDLARALREQRSRQGGAGKKPAASSGRMRQRPAASDAHSTDTPWKVVASETAEGQTITGTQVGRSRKVSGDEASTCRKVTGTEYMAADIFREFCQSDLDAAPRRSGLSESGSTAVMSGNKSGRNNRVTGTEHMGAETNKGKTVTGNKVGRSDRVTGDEIGASRELTGTQYMIPGNGEAPAKVSSSKTLRGGSITGVYIGQSERVTGNEAGSCRNVSGDDYIGQEQYRDFCKSIPKPKDQKVGISSTLRGEPVTGTLTGRSSKVTGDEPGTCKSVTGTPYVGLDQYQGFCNAEQGSSSLARIRPIRSTPGAVLTGLQPGIGGKMTGGNKGECEPLTGTPYVGTDQFADVCPAVAAEPGNADFPQSLGNAPWGQFSVSAQAPMAAAVKSGVTGTRYEQGHITGAFGKADGRVTGTEEFRFGHGNGSEAPAPVSMQEFEQISTASRITGEGMAAGKKITGDDWERGDRVTGTEGTSAVRRNPTRRGHSTAQMQVLVRTENPVEVPPSKVTGSSGNTEKGALVTYSGGARG